MTEDNSTVKDAPFHELALKALDSIDSILIDVKQQLGQQVGDNENQPVVFVLDGLSNYMGAVRDSINRYSVNTANKPVEAQHPAVIAVTNWLSSMPQQFPDYIEWMEPPPFKNPMIGNEPAETYRFVQNGLAFLLELALPWPGSETFRLGEEATRGYVNYLESMQAAMQFEKIHRREGGIPTEINNSGG